MSEFAKQSPLPATVTGEDGSAKRNILRKDKSTGAIMNRKKNSAGNNVDDGTLNIPGGAMDEGDPNFDSEDDNYAGFEAAERSINEQQQRFRRAYGDVAVGESKMTLTSYKQVVVPIIKEYLATGDIDECLLAIENVKASEYTYEFIKRAINMSLDQNDRERERISKLLSHGYPNTFSSNSSGKAFERIFEQIDETEKDCPKAREYISIYLARCIVDEVLPPSFLSDSIVINLGDTIVESTKRMLTQGPNSTNLENIWGPGDGRSVDEMKKSIDNLLTEFLSSNDLEEASRCVSELNAPEFMHEVIKRAITHVIGKSCPVLSCAIIPCHTLSQASCVHYLPSYLRLRLTSQSLPYL
jgi:programmed cell death protein 4